MWMIVITLRSDATLAEEHRATYTEHIKREFFNKCGLVDVIISWDSPIRIIIDRIENPINAHRAYDIAFSALATFSNKEILSARMQQISNSYLIKGN